MPVRDFNGSGPWAAEAVALRYREYALRHGVESPRSLEPTRVTRGENTWVYPVMDQVVLGVKAGDAACIVLAVEFIESDLKFAFGANLKARAARALRSASVPAALATRIRRRVAEMLATNNTPREFREYVRLVRKLGVQEIWPRLLAASPNYNKYSMRHFSLLRAVQERNPSVCRP
jgi:hypothetical protein